MGLRNFIFAVFYGVAANWPPAPIINRWIPNRYDYQILYELDSTKLEGSNLFTFDIEAPTFTHDIVIGFSATSGHSDRKWEIGLGIMGGTWSVIRDGNQGQYSRNYVGGNIVYNQHGRNLYDSFKNGFRIEVSVGYIGVRNLETNEVFLKYKSDDIVSSTLKYMLASGGFGGEGYLSVTQRVQPAPIINRWIPNRYDYQILYALDTTKLKGNNLFTFDIEAPTFTHDIHIGFSATSGHSDRKWEIGLGIMSGTWSVIRDGNQGQYSRNYDGGNIVYNQHGRRSYDSFKHGFRIEVSVGYIGVRNLETNEVFLKYESDDIVSSNLKYMLASGGWGGEGYLSITANWPPAPIMNRWIPNRYDYQILYELDSTKLEGSLLAFDIEAPTFTHDIHIGFSATSGHSDRKWEIGIGIMGGTWSVLRDGNQGQYSRNYDGGNIVYNQHGRRYYDSFKNKFRIEVSVGYIAVRDLKANEVFLRYESDDIVSSNFKYMLASGGFGGEGYLSVTQRELPMIGGRKRRGMRIN